MASRFGFTDDLKTEEWNDDIMVYTRWDLDGNMIEQRPYNEEELEYVQMMEEADSAIMELEERVARIEAHLWPAVDDPDPGDTTGIPTWDELNPENVWHHDQLLLDDGKVWRNVSGVPLTHPPSQFPGSGGR